MRRALTPITVLALVVASVGCGPRRRAWQPQPSAAPEAASFAVVWGGTPLRMRPDPRSPIFAVPALGRGPNDFAAFRLTRARGEWVELESLAGDDDAHCVPDLPGFGGLRVRVYVLERDLAQVSTRELSRRFDDRTAIALRRGVPMLAGRRHGYANAVMGALSVPLTAISSDMGTRYLPSAIEPLESELGELDTAEIARGSVGGARVQVASEASLPSASVAEGEEAALVDVFTRCGRLRMHAPLGAIERPVPRVSGALYSAVRVGRDTPVYFANGLRAGITAATRSLVGAELERSDGRRCFPFGGTSDAAGAPLCFDAADIFEGDPPGLARELSRP